MPPLRNKRRESASTLLSGSHGRMRRLQRDISKNHLHLARRYGIREKGHFHRIKYTWGGITFIYDPDQKKAITCYPNTKTTELAATRFHAPRGWEKLPANHEEHDERVQALFDQPWDSHTVLVVDLSGSMRQDDVPGALSRAHAVWQTLAHELVAKQLPATDRDAVSVVVLQERAHVLARAVPLDEHLHNLMFEWSDWNKCRPEGPGHYGPALEKVSELLQIQPDCSLAVLFCSDGRPSDGPADSEGISWADKVGHLAETYGRRLTFHCLAVASDDMDDDEFVTLGAMVHEAKAYGSIAELQRPSLRTAEWRRSVASLVSSLSDSKTSLSEHGRKQVRTDVKRERLSLEPIHEHELSEDWWIYSADRMIRLWTWCVEKDQIFYIRDNRCVFCYRATSFRDELCPECEACCICRDCPMKSHRGTEDCRTFANGKNSGFLSTRKVPSFSVAMKKKIFGEGAERVVSKFRFLDDDENFVGAPWVAKQSRFVEEEGSYEARMNYHRQFMRTQTLAQSFASQFNQALSHIQSSSPLPRIRFLEPLIVEVTENGKEKHLMIEEMLDGKYMKFNNNMGFVQQGTTRDESALPQAFSHFTYTHSRGNLMVVDLQGVVTGSEYILTDPAVHAKERDGLGRTNRGEAGMQAFWESHKCTFACRMLGLPPKP